MFTVFHTADWHLGQSFFGFDRRFEHSQFLCWLLEMLQEHKPDALVIAGDIFDTINPSAVSLKLFYGFLDDVRQVRPDLHIVITAGNHDSGSRLEAPADLLKTLNISVVGTVSQDESGTADVSRFVVPLHDSSGQLQATVLAVPFLRPADVPRVADAEDVYLDGIAELYRQATEAAVKQRQEQHTPIIAMGHCHVQGGLESRDSERRIVIGGAEALHPDVFPSELAYVALGHLHRAQGFRDGRIRYSGSPVPLSFSERSYEHRILKLCFEGRELQDVENLTVPVAVPILTVPETDAASMDDLIPLLEDLKVSSEATEEQYPFLEVRVLDDGPDPMRRKRIEGVLKDKPIRLASIKLETAATKESENAAEPQLTLSDLRTIDPERVFVNAWSERYDAEPNTEILEAFRQVVSQQVAGS